LHYCASVRAGFVPTSRHTLYEQLEPHITTRCPFVNVPEQTPGRWGQGLTAEKMQSCIWVRPRMVARCSFQEWTANDHLRRVSYVGLRYDKVASEVVKES
jgi:bifunctional non-homologous end joining protein LigD